MELTEIEIRIIGALIEKELTTPEYYPLTLNGLRNACNQKSNRNPVMKITEEQLLNALDELRGKKLAIFSEGQGQRVLKYKHNAEETLGVDQRELSLLAVLFLRGAQTQGELRQRTQRMHEFDSLEEIQQFLSGLAGREEPLVRQLARQPGQKEQRYIHLLSAYTEAENELSAPDEPSESLADLVASLNDRIDELQRELAELKLEYQNFKHELE
ncbi:MAG: DUF480 domain-containing protein [Candidatus Cloacimonetes bacterium]|nr:DUF480 domain-containing protein [Candidatus Cloacimonadota bacterium]